MRSDGEYNSLAFAAAPASSRRFSGVARSIIRPGWGRRTGLVRRQPPTAMRGGGDEGLQRVTGALQATVTLQSSDSARVALGYNPRIAMHPLQAGRGLGFWRSDRKTAHPCSEQIAAMSFSRNCRQTEEDSR